MTASQELIDAVKHLPDLVRDNAVAAADVEGLPSRAGITGVVILGVGPSRVAADVVAMLTELSGTVPILASGALCPRWVDENTLVIALAADGAGHGVQDAAAEAVDKSGRLIVVSPRGELIDWAKSNHIPVVPISAERTEAAGIGVAVVPLLVLLERFGLATDMNRMILETADQLEARRTSLEGRRERIDELASALSGRAVVVCAAGALGKHAARRWVQTLDRVGGIPAIRRRAPVTDEEFATFERLVAKVGADTAAVVLRHSYEPAGLVNDLERLDTIVGDVYQVDAKGEGPLAQLLDLVLVGDAVAAGARSQR